MTKRGILINDNFIKMTNLARIHQRFGKTSIEVTKRGILTNGDYHKKMANLGEKRQISAKMASVPKIHQGFDQLFE